MHYTSDFANEPHVRKQVTHEVHLQSQMYNAFGIEYYFM